MTISYSFTSSARHAMRAVMAAGVAILVATSIGSTSLMAQDFDRTKQPVVPPAKSLSFPKAQKTKLSNGIPVIVLEDHHSPVVAIQAVIRVDRELDPVGKTGLGSMTQGMLDEGTTKHSADQLANLFADLGNSVSPDGFYTITANVDKSLDLMAEQLLSPAFPQDALDRAKANRVAGLQQAKESPEYLAGRAFAQVVYGASHPYARQETEEQITSITRNDIVDFYHTYICPPNVQFVVAGDITVAEAVAKLNRVFGTWTKGKNGHVIPPAPAGVTSTAIYLYDRPGSPQSVVIVGNVGPRRDTPDQFPITLMNVSLGGAFTSRINLNLREQHQYTYGANSGFEFRPPPEVSTFEAQTAVATPKTDSAVRELMKEIRDIRAARPITESEFAFAKNAQTAGLPLQFETIGQRAGAVMSLVYEERPLDYYNTIIAKYNAVTLAQDRAAVKYVDPNKLAIVIVGDRKVIEPGLRAANLGPIVVVKPF